MGWLVSDVQRAHPRFELLHHLCRRIQHAPPKFTIEEMCWNELAHSTYKNKNDNRQNIEPIHEKGDLLVSDSRFDRLDLVFSVSLDRLSLGNNSRCTAWRPGFGKVRASRTIQERVADPSVGIFGNALS